MKVVISGSFRKHLTGIIELKNQLENLGVVVLKPDKFEKIKNPTNPNFVKFKGEETKSSTELQIEYMEAIRQSDAHIIFNKNSYFGTSATVEMGYSLGKRNIYLLEMPDIEKMKCYNEEYLETYTYLHELIKSGKIKIGLNTLLSDFNINKSTELEAYK